MYCPLALQRQEVLGDSVFKDRTGADEQMQVQFRDVDPFDLWVSSL